MEVELTALADNKVGGINDRFGGPLFKKKCLEVRPDLLSSFEYTAAILNLKNNLKSVQLKRARINCTFYINIYTRTKILTKMGTRNRFMFAQSIHDSLNTLT